MIKQPSFKSYFCIRQMNLKIPHYKERKWFKIISNVYKLCYLLIFSVWWKQGLQILVGFLQSYGKIMQKLDWFTQDYLRNLLSSFTERLFYNLFNCKSCLFLWGSNACSFIEKFPTICDNQSLWDFLVSSPQS